MGKMLKNKEAQAIKHLLDLNGISLESLRSHGESVANDQMEESNKISQVALEAMTQANEKYNAGLKALQDERSVVVADVQKQQAKAAELYTTAQATRKHLAKVTL
jgi:hypothetical protein